MVNVLNSGIYSTKKVLKESQDNTSILTKTLMYKINSQKLSRLHIILMSINIWGNINKTEILSLCARPRGGHQG